MLLLKSGSAPEKIIYAGASLCFLFISVYVLRAVRDEMAIQVGITSLSWLISLSFVLLVLFSLLFSFSPGGNSRLFRAFITGLCIFFISIAAIPQYLMTSVATVLFIVIGCSNLLLVSQFWKGLGDYFPETEAKTAYPLIMLIGSSGVLLGPLLVTMLAAQPIAHLLGISCLCLGISALLPIGMKKEMKSIESSKPVGILPRRRSQWPVAGFVLMYSTLATVLYGEHIATVERFSLSQEERMHFFGKRDLWIGLITLALQWLGQKLKHADVRWAGLRSLPFLTLMILLTIGWYNSLETILWSFVLFRSFNYAYARPARELYFAGTRGKFSFKSFIDTVVYRAGDLLGIWLFQLLIGWQFDYLQIAALLIPLIGLWILFTKKIVKTLNA